MITSVSIHEVAEIESKEAARYYESKVEDWSWLHVLLRERASCKNGVP